MGGGVELDSVTDARMGHLLLDTDISKATIYHTGPLQREKHTALQTTSELATKVPAERAGHTS